MAAAGYRPLRSVQVQDLLPIFCHSNEPIVSLHQAFLHHRHGDDAGRHRSGAGAPIFQLGHRPPLQHETFSPFRSYLIHSCRQRRRNHLVSRLVRGQDHLVPGRSLLHPSRGHLLCVYPHVFSGRLESKYPDANLDPTGVNAATFPEEQPGISWVSSYLPTPPRLPRQQQPDFDPIDLNTQPRAPTPPPPPPNPAAGPTVALMQSILAQQQEQQRQNRPPFHG